MKFFEFFINVFAVTTLIVVLLNTKKAVTPVKSPQNDLARLETNLKTINEEKALNKAHEALARYPQE